MPGVERLPASSITTPNGNSLMKYQGKKIEGLRKILCVIARDEEDIGFYFQGIADEEEFDKLSPVPQPRSIKNVKDGTIKLDVDNPVYKTAFEEWSSRRTNWMFLKSIQATEGLEWETVNINDPGTWHNWQTELRNSGFTSVEIRRLLNAFAEAQSLDQSTMDEAKKRFLSLKLKGQEVSSSQTDGQTNLQSGELVKG